MGIYICRMMKERSSEEILGSNNNKKRILGVKTRNFFATNDGKETLQRTNFERCRSEGTHSYWGRIRVKSLWWGFWRRAVQRDFGRSIPRG